MMKEGWKEEMKRLLRPESLIWDPVEIQKFSTDFSYLSPVLKRLLAGKTADAIVRPADMEELQTLIEIAYSYQVPLTPRGNGTSNYGQSVPLTGGVVVDFTRLNQILEIGDGFMRVQGGTNMLRMEQAARAQGQEMMLLPTTHKKSTIAGFLLGGFGGVGSVQHGTIWDGMVKSLKIQTLDAPSRTYTVSGEEVKPFLHSYGVLGFVTEVTVALVPSVAWNQLAVLFESWEQAAQFGLDVADSDLHKRLVSVNEWPIPRYFTPLPLAKDRSVVFVMIDRLQMDRFQLLVEKWGGSIDYTIPPEKLYRGADLADFSFGHYRLWVQKQDPAYTNIQINFDRTCFIAQMKELKKEFPDLLAHFEILKRNGVVETNGTPIFKYGTEERIERLKARCYEIGAPVEDPHTYDLEAGGRAYEIRKMWEIKGENDPCGLLNQQKLAPLSTGSA